MALRQLLSFLAPLPRPFAPAILSLRPAANTTTISTFPSILPTISIAYPATTSIRLDSWLSDVWESVLRAVPKKKTSHSKKRHRQMAGKALKDVTHLNKCSGCGRVKRAHVLCPFCVLSIRNWFREGALGKPAEKLTQEKNDSKVLSR